MPKLEDLARERSERRAPRPAWEAEEVGALAKNSREAVVVRVLASGGRKFVDVREFYFDASSSEYRPTRHGVTLDGALLSELLGLLSEAGRRLA